MMRRLLLPAMLILTALNAHAGKDPIGWSMTGTVPAITELNQSYSLSFTLINNLPFTMPTPLRISNNSTPANQVTMHDNCSGQKLAPNATCDVGLVLVPTSAGHQELSVFMEYGKNKVQIPKAPVKSRTLAGSASQLQGVATNGLPSAIRSNSTYVLTFTFSNIGTTPLTGVSYAPKANNTAGFTQTSATNCGTTLPVGGPSCVITGTFTTSASTGAVSVGYTGTAGTFTASPTTSAVINNNTGVGTRTFIFENKCSQPVYFAMNGGGLGISGCTSNADCDAKTGIPGAFACGTTANAGAGGCFWKDPAPTSGSFLLPATNGTATVYLTEYVYTYTPPAIPSNPNPGPVTAVWSGNVAGRTGCTSGTPGSCATAYCGSATTPANGNCAPGVGFQVPATLAEMTLQPSGDSYDLSVINGLNLTMSMAPNSGTTSPTNPYTCGTAGSTANQGSGSGGILGACAWNLGTTVPSVNYVWVANQSGSPTACSSNATCTAIDATYACGLSLSSVQANSASTYCGTWLGYWTADQVCGTNTSYDKAPYSCTSSADGGAQFTQMYACAGSPSVYNNSCYSNGATSNCCGCQNWQNAPTSLTVPDAAHGVLQCQASNTTWNNNARATVSWIKTSCPSSYVYPFDDKSSSFTCANSSTANSVSYTITFCPGNNSGAPTGTTPSLAKHK